ncbi:hypothetical protein [Stakelama marina]|uniref:Flagellar protein FlgN n=1 Tax=Stakelama marina TaxID=2826939 RepID=A0A8T4I9Y0_9SPHN|nr:hypothetical protein [Stakelama marina]MBR0550942.1 hypothetical protein [Stakelama marina]
MIEEMLDTARSLAALMEEESNELTGRGRHTDHAEIAAAKTRLVARLETEVARLNRESADWVTKLDEADSTALSDAMAALRDAAIVNAGVLDRQLSLSNEMIDAVSAEAKRLTGNRGLSYQATGALFARDGSSPISVNTRL